MGEGVYAIAGGKGGVGKTTTAINLGVVLGQAGYEVVVVDADLAMPDVGRRLHVDGERGLHSVLADETPIRETVVEGPAGIAVLPGEWDLASFADANPERLRKALDLLEVAYDVVLIDTAPGLQNEAVITYQEVDGVVLVTTPEENAVEDGARTGRLAADVGTERIGAVVTRGEGRRARRAAAELDSDLLALVPQHSTGGPITAAAPDDAAADAYRRVAAALPAVDARAVVPEGEVEIAGGSDADRGESGAGETDLVDLVDDAVETAQGVDVDHVDDGIGSVADAAAADDGTGSTAVDDETEDLDRGANGTGS